ncbi:hypothetical protein PG999_004287 [Apiospora kogelbergensis]|uniref:F-box domain-containing protein n=1 Tax=Apiospora kogelbergensis TaxID=1337665 RepID=A0AAW0QYX5_9PEZI
MEFLTINEPTRLDSLPLDILLIILRHLNTARSVAYLGIACRRLREVVKVDGWRNFVRSRFNTLRLPQSLSDDEWHVLAKNLTWQSRAWERHALTVDSLVPHREQQRSTRDGADRRHFRPAQRTQTFPCQIIVDASCRQQGNSEQETVVWGAGEDIVARYRNTSANTPQSEVWHTLAGSQDGFQPGKDDVTSISILDQEAEPNVVVGRASGDLRLLSLDPAQFGRTRMTFQPSVNEDVKDNYTQNEIQALDFCQKTRTLGAITKDNVLLYAVDPCEAYKLGNTEDNEGAGINVMPKDVFNVHTIEGSKPFKTIRCMRFTANEGIALGLTSSTQPLRYLTLSPTGPRLDAASKILPSARATDSYALKGWANATVRGLLPIDTASIAGGKGNVILSSYEDGTIRLQDMRSPSPIDTIYQDNFEVMTPSGALLSYGTERFIAGNARSNNVKIFDFRWNKSYLHTASLPCSSEPPYPSPRPPTLIKPPSHPERSCCDYMTGHECRWHALSRDCYYRPNYTVYLPMVTARSSPVYSLAKPSDTSPTLYAGLAGELVEMSLREDADYLRKRPHAAVSKPLYACRRGLASILETGDGFSLSDISSSQRVPEMRTQSNRVQVDYMPQSARDRHRLDEHIQFAGDFPVQST